MAEFWVKQSADSAAEGPYSSNDLRKFAAEGSISPKSLISNNRQRWQIAETVRGLFPAANPPEPAYEVAPAAPVATAPLDPATTIFCRTCGCANDRRAANCQQCQAPLFAPPLPGTAPFPSPDIGQDAGMRMLLPVGRSPWAIVAGYMGLFSILLVPAPLAVIFGVIAIVDIRRHPDRHGMGRAIFGLAMGSLVLLALAVPLVIALIRG